MTQIDPLPRGCGVETPEASQHRPFPWYNFHPSPTYFRMDARRGSDGVHQGPPRHRSTQSRGCSSCYIRSCVYAHHQLSDTAKGLCFLHSRNIVHGDLKGVRDYSELGFAAVLTRAQSNILVDGVGRARITDFGLAVFTRNPDSIQSVSSDQEQTVRWIAPEILNRQGTYSKEADVFSWAMVMIEARQRQPIVCRNLAH